MMSKKIGIIIKIPNVWFIIVLNYDFSIFMANNKNYIEGHDIAQEV